LNKYFKEKEHFLIFRKFIDHMPIGEVWHNDRPDFLVYANEGVIGIEHSLVHISQKNRHPLQAIESQTDEIISLAKEYSELSGVPPIHAQFNFRVREDIDKTNRIGMARDIARLVYHSVPKDVKPRSMMELFYPEHDDAIVSIQIYTLQKDSEHFWNAARAGWSIESCIDILQKSISKKESLINSYLKKCNVCWLLLVGEAKPSGFVHPNGYTTNHEYISSFKNIYYLDLTHRHLHRLKTIAI
jgi:hypothetical protein